MSFINASFSEASFARHVIFTSSAFRDELKERLCRRNPIHGVQTINLFLSRWRLQRAFYHREGVGETGCSGIDLADIFPLWTCLIPAYKVGEEEVRPLTLADLKGIKPEYLANIVVNRWKKSAESQNSYELLTMSPTEIERIDRDPNKEQFKDRLEPEDLMLSDVMATSAAALSTHMGKYDYSIKGLSRLHTVLQLEMGATMISDVKSVKRESFTMRVS